MWTHRLLGIALTTFGLAVLLDQLAVLYDVVGNPDIMVRIGLPGSAILSCLGAVGFATGCLLAAAPSATVRHASRIAAGLRRR